MAELNFDRVYGKYEPPVQGSLTSNRIGAGVDNYQAGLWGLAETALDSDYAKQKRLENEADAQYQQRNSERLGAVDDWRNVDGVGSGLNYLGGLAAQSLPYLAEAAAGGLIGRGLMTGTRAALGAANVAGDAAEAARLGGRLAYGQTAGAVGASYPSAVGDILQNQRAENPTGMTDLGSAALGGVPYAALNAFGIEGLAARGLKPLAQFDGNILARMGKQGAVTALSEGASETGQELINQSFGRMAVNPEQTLFNEEANKRYVDSFVGGAALGGSMGSLSGIRRQAEPAKPTVEQQPDLLDRAGEPLGIGFSGYDTGVGQIIAFPDGSSMLRSEWEQLAREGRTPDLESKYPGFLQQYGQADGPLFASAEQPQEGGALGTQPGQIDLFNPNGTATYNADADSFAPNATPNLVTQLDPLQQRIDQNLGINRGGFAGKGYPKQFEAAASEPTNAFAIDPNTGMERRLDIGQLTAAQAPGANLSPVQREVQARAQTKLADHKAKQRTAAELGLDPKNVQHTEATGLLMMAMQNGVLDENQALDVAGTIMAATQQPELGKPLAIARKAVKSAEKAKATVAKQDAAQDAYETKLLGPSVQLGTTGNNTGAPQSAAATKTTAPASPAAAPSVPGGTAPAVAKNNGAVKASGISMNKETTTLTWEGETKVVPTQAFKRLQRVLGMDVDGRLSGTPMTYEEAGKAENAERAAAGLAPLKDPTASVQKSLKQHFNLGKSVVEEVASADKSWMARGAVAVPVDGDAIASEAEADAASVASDVKTSDDAEFGAETAGADRSIEGDDTGFHTGTSLQDVNNALVNADNKYTAGRKDANGRVSAVESIDKVLETGPTPKPVTPEGVELNPINLVARAKKATRIGVEHRILAETYQGTPEGDHPVLAKIIADYLSHKASVEERAAARRNTYDPAKDEARAANEKRAAAARDAAVSAAEKHPDGVLAAQMWDNLRSEESPEFGSLTSRQKQLWFAEYADHQRGVTDGKSIEDIQRDVEAEVLRDRDSASRVPGRLVQPVESVAGGNAGNRQAESGGGVAPDAVTPVTPEALFAAEVTIARADKGGKAAKPTPSRLALVGQLMDAGLQSHPDVGVFWKALIDGKADIAKGFLQATKPDAAQARAPAPVLDTAETRKIKSDIDRYTKLLACLRK